MVNTVTTFLGNILMHFKGARVFNYIAGLQDDVSDQYDKGNIQMNDSKKFWQEMVTTLAKIGDWLIPVVMIIVGMAGSIYCQYQPDTEFSASCFGVSNGLQSISHS